MPRKNKEVTRSNVTLYGSCNMTEADLKSEYVNSPISLQQLAAKYDITFNTVKRLSRVGKWSYEKQNKSRADAIKVEEIVCDDIIQFKADCIRKNYEHLAKTQVLIGMSIDKMIRNNAHNLQELLCLTRILENINKICTGTDVNIQNTSENVTLDKLDKLITNIKQMEISE